MDEIIGTDLIGIYNALLKDEDLLIEAMNNPLPAAVIGKRLSKHPEISNGRSFVGCVRLANNFLDYHREKLKEYVIK